MSVGIYQSKCPNLFIVLDLKRKDVTTYADVSIEVEGGSSDEIRTAGSGELRSGDGEFFDSPPTWFGKEEPGQMFLPLEEDPV